ncbi:MAG TPA: DUF4912 domain-containing protein [Spirochaetota bacterium]|nr:DUF4912 domain-containing protein [Spirochaetota bacterium]OPZ38778.1 MAG: hypothetical protein BWY96_00736 [Spirochaetes bacterium ADurb.BinA120]HNU91953.1 DUF4912 domain-containing protein [Spirochaetota bacterium]HPI14547.1 DUF4912 domain-containing protein [Spirochaetota bacterium]HPV98503.1 DUF4912 domain-containing protein [Spirochaetota bacterium]
MPGKTTKKAAAAAPVPGRSRKKAAGGTDYLIALLVDGAGIYATWKLSDPLYGKILRKALTDHQGDPYLFLRVREADSGGRAELDEIPVYGRENRWHIFTTGEMAGRRIVIELSYQTATGKRETVLQSAEIDVPLGDEALAAILGGPLFHDERLPRLYEVSGVREHLAPSSPGLSSH